MHTDQRRCKSSRYAEYPCGFAAPLPGRLDADPRNFLWNTFLEDEDSFVYHRQVQRLRLLLVLVLLGSAVRASGQATSPSAAAAEADAQPLAPLSDDRRATRKRDPILLVTEGLEAISEPAALRARLAELFGRPVIGLSDPDASSALATLYVASDGRFVVLRLSMEDQADLWQRLPRSELGRDPIAIIANAVLDMLWSDRLAQSAASEMLDPFCPPGLICVDAERRGPRAYGRRRGAEPSVLDPWDGSYQRFGGSDLLSQPRRYHTRGDPWSEEQQAEYVPSYAPAAQIAQPPAPARARPAGWALGLLAGGGVHAEGGFVRYEVNVLRRFSNLDIGLTFVGGRGQPDAAANARRAVAALIQGRLVMEGLELNLGGSFGTFMAKQRGESAEVRPYLRALSVFALPISDALHFTIQSEVGTTFSDVNDSGAFEYALSVGFRQQL